MLKIAALLGALQQANHTYPAINYSRKKASMVLALIYISGIASLMAAVFLHHFNQSLLQL